MCGADPFENGWDPTLREKEYRDEIERLREAIRTAIEMIDADGIIEAHEHLTAALGEKK
jgi:hypothetical protein